MGLSERIRGVLIGSIVVLASMTARTFRKMAGTVFYMIGSLSYIVGGLLSEFAVGVVAFSSAWLIGSGACAIGAFCGLVF